MDNFILHMCTRTLTRADFTHHFDQHLPLRSLGRVRLWRVRLIVSDCEKTRRHINQVKYKRGAEKSAGGSRGARGWGWGWGAQREGLQRARGEEIGRGQENKWRGWNTNKEQPLRVKAGRESRPGRRREPGDSLHPASTKKRWWAGWSSTHFRGLMHTVPC